MRLDGKNQFGKLSVVELVEFELQNSITLPKDYRDFLLEFNGGKPIPSVVPSVNSDIQNIYGMHNGPFGKSLYKAIDLFSKRIPSWYIPIATDSGGNQYIMSLFHENKGLIAFWKHEFETDGDASQYYDNVVFAANSFSELLESLIA